MTVPLWVFAVVIGIHWVLICFLVARHDTLLLRHKKMTSDHYHQRMNLLAEIQARDFQLQATLRPRFPTDPTIRYYDNYRRR